MRHHTKFQYHSDEQTKVTTFTVVEQNVILKAKSNCHLNWYMALAGLGALGAAGVHRGLQALGGWLTKHCSVNFPSLQLVNSLNEERQQTQTQQCYNLLLGDVSG